MGSLPAESTSFVGRGAELRAVRDALGAARLVTLTGAGGVGKTRLAVHAGRDLRRAYPDGVWHVALGSIEDGDLIGYAVVETLGLRAVSEVDPLGHLIDYLADRTLLLVLDNCEHLLDGCARLVLALLSACPKLRILCTSRQPLGVVGEVSFVVAPLQVPAHGPAVTLFAQRAAAVAPGFTVNTGNERRVAEICDRLDGLPLAIELAAARVRTLSVDELAERLTETVPGQRGPLRETFDWSFALCSAAERTVWTRLSVFAGGFDLDAAVGVCGDETLCGDGVVAALIGLVDKSVVVCDEAGAQARYRLLETVREYGVARLAAAGQDPELLRRRHRDWYLGLVQRFDREWFGRDQIGWAERIRAALANVRVALEWCLHTPGEIEAGQEVAAALRYYWTGCGGLSEGRLWLGRVLATEPRPVPARARALSAQTRLLIAQADHPCAARSAAESLELAHDTGDPLLLASARYEAGAAILLRGGDMAAADLLLRDALAALEALGTAPLTAAMAMTTRAFTTLYLGDPPGAQLLCTRARRLCRRHGDRWWLAYTLHASAVVAGNRGDREAAERYTQEALQLHVSLGDTLGIVASFDELAENATAAGHLERAARLLGAGLEMSESMGTDSVARRRYWRGREALMESVRSRYGEPNFGTAFGYGRRMSVEDAIAYACRVEPEPRPPVAVPAPVTLTRREREVADLLGEGLSNAQIAQRLVVSQRTAESHVANVMRKLGATSRSQVAVWARTHPL